MKPWLSSWPQRLLLVCLPLLQHQTGLAASLLSNPGFESDGAGESENLPGWTTYGFNTYSESSTAIAHSGSNYFKVYQAFTGVTNYTGIYQDYISGAGAVYAADGWVYTASSDTIAGQNTAWLEVTFRDADANVLALYRSTLITTNHALAASAFPVGKWTDLAVTNQYNPATLLPTNHTAHLVAPVGTYFVRYQIVFAGDARNSAGSVYFDDLNLVQTAGTPYGSYNIVWSDEFNGTAINSRLWTNDIGNGGWGNNELEYYTSRTNNALEAGGYLHIIAQKESYGGAGYTSARMKSEGLFSLLYGRLEWRAQLPAGTGFWPALWLLGTNITSINWPNCGEIDVMENNGGVPGTVQGSLHSGSDETGFYDLLPGDSVTNFHTYTLDWTTNAILYYVDGHLYQIQASWTSASGSYPFPFNQPFFIIMNVAVGGNYLGNPTTNAIDAGSTFPSAMLVDYVRLCRPTAPLTLTITRTNKNLLLAWPTNIVCHLQGQLVINKAGLGTNWIDLPQYTNSLLTAPTNGGAFYRLESP